MNDHRSFLFMWFVYVGSCTLARSLFKCHFMFNKSCSLWYIASFTETCALNYIRYYIFLHHSAVKVLLKSRICGLSIMLLNSLRWLKLHNAVPKEAQKWRCSIFLLIWKNSKRTAAKAQVELCFGLDTTKYRPVQKMSLQEAHDAVIALFFNKETLKSERPSF